MTIRSILMAMATAFVLCLPMAASAQQREDVAALNDKLFTAVRGNDIATVRLVLTNGADPMALDSNGQTPAGVAIDRGYFDIAHHILGVRNQRQAITRRDTDEELANPRTAAVRASSSAAFPSAPGQNRTPDVTWRQTSAPGQAAEIPTPRLSSPQEAVVITPSSISNGPLASRAAGGVPTPMLQKKAPEKAPAAQANAATPAPGNTQQPVALVNLPTMAAGAPNPFDPRNAEPAMPPVVSTMTPAAPTPAPGSTGTDQSGKPSTGNPLSRIFNGITGVFGGGGS